MSIIYKCDICHNEIIDMQEGGELKFVKKVIGFLKHNKQEQVKQVNYLFCVACAEKMIEYKKQLENGK